MINTCPHCGHRLGPPAMIEWGGWSLDPGRSLVNGVHLPGQQVNVMAALIRAQGAVVLTERLQQALWGLRGNGAEKELVTLRSHIYQIRKRVTAFGGCITSLPQIGYYLEKIEPEAGGTGH